MRMKKPSFKVKDKAKDNKEIKISKNVPGKKPSGDTAAIISVTVASLLWGTTYSTVRYGLSEMDLSPFSFLFLRFLIALFLTTDCSLVLPSAFSIILLSVAFFFNINLGRE